MAQRITAAELEQLVNDDSVSDDELARYLKPAPVRSAPFRPMLTFDNTTVEAPADRGILGLAVTALNDRANRRRAAAFSQRLADAYNGPKILAEGDSWFLYPILLRDIVDDLANDYAVFSVAAAGDTLENMARDAAQLESLVDEHDFDALVFSAGGNDIAGDPLQTYLRSLPGRSRPAAEYVAKTYDTFLANAKTTMGGLLGRLLEKFPHLHIFGHGYDWPFPADNGLWLGPVFIRQGVPMEVRAPVLKLMINRYYDMLHEVEAELGGRYHVVDCRDTVGGPSNWFDELHPFNAGFERAAGKFRTKINETLGIAASRGAPKGGGAARITWRPAEETTGARKQSRIYPVGSVITVGRHADREIMLDDERISRTHATLTVRDGALLVKDSSSNGSFLDGRRISEAVWKAGQTLRIGHYVFTLEFEAAPVGPKAGLSALQEFRPPPPMPLPPMPAMPQPSAPAVLSHPLMDLRIVVSGHSITKQPASTLAIGMFENVHPLASRSAARAIDEHYRGYLSNVLESRFVYGQRGSITTLPLPKDRGVAANLLLVGLGTVSAYLPGVIEVAGEAIARTLVATHALDLATIPMGANSGVSLKDSIESFLTGFLRGLQSDRAGKAIRSLRLCEVKRERYEAMAQTIRALQGSNHFEACGFRVALEEHQPEASESDTSAPAADRAPDRAHYLKKVYLDVTSSGGLDFDYALVGAPGAAIPCFSRTAAPSVRLQAVLDASNCPGFDEALGREVADAFMPVELQRSLERELSEENGHIVVIHDGASAAVPWEASYIGGQPLALQFGLSRQQKPSTRAAAKLIQRTMQPDDGRIRMLLVYDPTCDLIGTENEAQALTDLFSSYGCEIKALKREECTKEAVLAELMKGTYDLLHFAGHAGFTKLQPEVSGIVLANRTYLCASDLEVLPSVPRLIFLNACQSGRVRGAERPPPAGAPLREAAGGAGGRDGATGHASLAEGLILRNVMQFIGTYWLVNDEAASRFAIEFYSRVLEGRPVGEAIRDGRRKLFDARLSDWVNYLHFGEPGELLRKGPGSPGSQDTARSPSPGADAEAMPDPLSGEGQLRPAAGAARTRGLDLPISHGDTLKVGAWMEANFGDAMAAAAGGTPFTVEHLCAIVCQETAYFWKDLIDRLSAPELLERCVLDASGDFPGTSRRPFPVNTQAFRARYGDDLTNMLIGEANKTRALRHYGPKDWVYKGYGIFQYDLQYILTDEPFFRERQWAQFDVCLAKAMGELKQKNAATGDVWRAIRAYNGSGPAAENYARNVAQFHAWLTEGHSPTVA